MRSGPSTTAATNVHDAGFPGPAVVWAMTASLAASAAAMRALALAAMCVAAVPIPWGLETARTSRAARAAEAGHVRVGRRGDPVTHDEHRVAARLGPGVQGDGVLVAGVPNAAIAHGCHPRGRLLAEVVAWAVRF